MIPKRTIAAFVFSLGSAAASHAQAPAPVPAPAAAPQILVYTPQGQPMALTPYPVPPEVQRSALRVLIEDTPGRIVVVRHASQKAIPLTGGGALEIESIGVFEPGYEEQRLFGIRVTVNRAELPGPERTFYLEPREVDPLVQAIHVIEEVLKTPTANATDVEFHLTEGLGFGYRTRSGRGERYLRASRGETFRVPLAADGLTQLSAALEGARAGLFAN